MNLDRLHAALDRLTRTMSVAGFAGLGMVAMLTTYEGAARYVGWPRIIGFSDILGLLLAVIIATSFPAGLLEQNNVTIRFLGKALPRSGYRLIEVFAGLVTLVFFALVIWQFWEFVLDSQRRGASTRTIELPLAPAWAVATALLAVALPVQVVVILRWWRALRGRGPEPRH
jgi:TRAP-type C4-dicarboxylate transport system permease small subunit